MVELWSLLNNIFLSNLLLYSEPAFRARKQQLLFCSRLLHYLPYLHFLALHAFPASSVPLALSGGTALPAPLHHVRDACL